MVSVTDVSLGTNVINNVLVSRPLTSYAALVIPMTLWLEELKDVCTNIIKHAFKLITGLKSPGCSANLCLKFFLFLIFIFFPL